MKYLRSTTLGCKDIKGWENLNWFDIRMKTQWI